MKKGSLRKMLFITLLAVFTAAGSAFGEVKLSAEEIGGGTEILSTASAEETPAETEESAANSDEEEVLEPENTPETESAEETNEEQQEPDEEETAAPAETSADTAEAALIDNDTDNNGSAEQVQAEASETPGPVGKPVIRRIIHNNPTVTYLFLNEDNKEINRQILSNDETLVKPVSPEKDNEIFDGWFIDKDNKFPDDNFGKTAQELNGNEPLAGSKTVELKAHFSSLYHVSYLDADGHVAFTETYKAEETIHHFADLRKEVHPKNTNEELIGWSTEKIASVPLTELTVDSDKTLYPVFANAHWIDFDANGGNPVDPVYVSAGAVTEDPNYYNETGKPGYTFDGWYTGSDFKTKFIFGSTLDDDITLYAKWVEAEKTPYTIIYYVQSKSDRYDTPDDKKTYSRYGIKKLEGRTESTVIAADHKNDLDDYWDHQVTFNAVKSDTQITVEPGGSSELNLYFDRNVITFSFYSNDKLTDCLGEYEGLYGQSFSNYGYTMPAFPDKEKEDQGQFWLDKIKNWEWHSDEDLCFYDPSNSGKTNNNFYPSQGSIYYRYYMYYENLDGTWSDDPDPKNGIIAYTPGHTWVYSKRSNNGNIDYYLDQYKKDIKKGNEWSKGDWISVYDENGNFIKGTVTESGSFIAPIGSNSPGDDTRLYYRLKRSVHNFKLVNPATEHSELKDIISFTNIRYGTPIKDLSKYYEGTEELEKDIKNPPRPEGLPEYYVFDGWYTSTSFTSRFNFDTQVMGTGNKVAYAHWIAPKKNVLFISENNKVFQRESVTAGEAAERPVTDPERKDFKFVEWVDKNGRPYDFKKAVTENTILYASWYKEAETYQITYDLNGGAGTPAGNEVTVNGNGYTDKTRYRSGAIAKAASFKWTTTPAGKTGFIGWQLIESPITESSDTAVTNGPLKAPENAEEETLSLYYPGDSIPIRGYNIILKAVWADSRRTTLTYDYDYDGKKDTEVIEVPNSDYTISKADPERDSYIFKGWQAIADHNLIVKSGDHIHIDTIHPEHNILKAIWEKKPEEKKTADIPAAGKQNPPEAPVNTPIITRAPLIPNTGDGFELYKIEEQLIVSLSVAIGAVFILKKNQ